ncbi:Hemerythrin HHE cation binding domain-containing protein [Chitinophaga costaii]|uniref:Hemerythrin HHE cation binding domain-containing protein n=1 Tax=Chitinophaga costaii TaxID=1335309 RepID=A0A1C4E5H5_9BACT|nr:hemerythrin domain-containing protein [Chitinophaga costaii]PUZ24311.1 hemerythrin domain-containing protein [Chitinophaga costaii]SCC38834.1 Hemerythrin HHE cation binding domain-containing protein [Chitinophaga costaii]
MPLHATLQPLMEEHQRILQACDYLYKTEHKPALTTQERFAFVVKTFQQEMVPHQRKEQYIFDACKGKLPELDFLIAELEAEHLHLSRLYSTLTETVELDEVIDQIAEALTVHILKEEAHFYEIVQRQLPEIIDNIVW